MLSSKRLRRSSMVAWLGFAASMTFATHAEASFASFIHKVAGGVKNAAHATVDGLHDVGSVVHDAGVTLGKDIKNADGSITQDIVDKGQVVGHAIIQSGKVVATETVVTGKVVERTAETGGKYIVQGGQIVGKEIVVNGNVVGQEVIKDGKVVEHKVIDASHYLIKEGQLVYDAVSHCKEIGNLIPMPKLACKNLDGAIECSEAATVGFICKIPKALDDLKALPEIKDQIAKEAQSSDCQKGVVPPLPEICAAGKVLANNVQQSFDCLVDAGKAGVLKDLFSKPDNGSKFPSQDLCFTAGEWSLQALKFQSSAMVTSSKERAQFIIGSLIATYKLMHKVENATKISDDLKKIPACTGN